MDRTQDVAVRELYDALSEAMHNDPAVVAAKAKLEKCGMILSHVEMRAFFSLALFVRTGQRQSDADFLQSLRIASDVTPHFEGKFEFDPKSES
jgi:hypothetical protein